MGEVGAGRVKDGVSGVLAIVGKGMEGWRASWVGLGCGMGWGLEEEGSPVCVMRELG
jgi:hypothetical protein